MSEKLVAVAVLTLFLGVASSGCILGSQEFVHESLNSGITLRLSIDEPEALFEDGTALRLIVELGYPRDEGFLAGVTLPEGVALVSGDLRLTGPLEADSPTAVEAVVRADSAGTYDFWAWAETFTACNQATSLAVRVSGDSSAATTEEVVPDKPDFTVSLHPDPENASRISVRVDAPVETSGWICLGPGVDPTTGELLQILGNHDWHGALDSGNHSVFEFEVTAPEPGDYGVGVRMHPDPGASVYAYHHSIPLTYRNGTFEPA